MDKEKDIQHKLQTQQKIHSELVDSLQVRAMIAASFHECSLFPSFTPSYSSSFSPHTQPFFQPLSYLSPSSLLSSLFSPLCSWRYGTYASSSRSPPSPAVLWLRTAHRQPHRLRHRPAWLPYSIAAQLPSYVTDISHPLAFLSLSLLCYYHCNIIMPSLFLSNHRSLAFVNIPILLFVRPPLSYVLAPVAWLFIIFIYSQSSVFS